MTRQPKQTNWVKERWFDLRNGYSLYLALFLSFLNFILLVSVKFPTVDILLLGILVGTAVSAVSIAIGYVHRKKQLRTDQDSIFKQSHLAAQIQLIILKAIQNTATKEDIELAHLLLQSIIDGEA